MTDEINQYDEGGSGNAVKGYKIIIAIMVVIMVVMSFLYFQQIKELRGSTEDLTIARDELVANLDSLKVDYSNIRTENDTISQQLVQERFRADSLIDKLKKERSWSYAKIKKYEKELGTLRLVMKGYIHQIDSLNQLNSTLRNENTTIKRELSATRGRADRSEELAQELTAKMRKGSVITARDIDLKALNSKDQQVKKARRATNLRVDFILNANSFAVLGERDVYVRIRTQSNMVLANSASGLFEFESQKITFSAKRPVDYQGEDLPVGIYFAGGDVITEGRYNVEIYMDGYLIGTNEIILQ